MKKVLAVAVATGILAAASFASAASIVGSKHDLTNATGTGSKKGPNTQICVYCHAPHGALVTYPLWNRTNPTVVYKLYSGSGMQSRQFQTGFTDDSTSLFCMSCHDGNMQMEDIHNKGALTNHGAYNSAGAGTAGLTFATGAIGGNAALANDGGGVSNDLTLTHPINFPVPTVNNSQDDLWVGTGPAMGGGAGTTTTTFPLFTVKEVTAGGNNNTARATSRSLECGSCHAVHDSLNSPFLRYTMAGSQLCLGCHNK